MTIPVVAPRKIHRADIILAIISLLFLLAVRPLLAQTVLAQTVLAQTVLNPANSTNTTAPASIPTTDLTDLTDAANPATNPALTATPTPFEMNRSTYLNPPITPPLLPGSKRAVRAARNSERKTNFNSPLLESFPECRIEDTVCIEQRNRLNQMNPQTAPTFNR